MTDDDFTDTSPARWLWILLFAAMAALIVIWLINTWVVDSQVKPGASPEGLAFPANPGFEVAAPTDKPAEGGAAAQ